jgi:hypothetical protein
MLIIKLEYGILESRQRLAHLTGERRMKMKIKFAELEKMSYEAGREMLLNAGYVPKDNAVDQKEEYNICDEYYTLFDDEDNELHVVSYATYTKDVSGDEPEFVNEENWHWLEISGGWGGSREGAGRPATGRKRHQYYVTDEENEKLRKYLEELRKPSK